MISESSSVTVFRNIMKRFLRGQRTRSSFFRGNLLSFPATQRKSCRSGVAPRLCRCDRLTYGPCGSSASICRSETPETRSRCSDIPAFPQVSCFCFLSVRPDLAWHIRRLAAARVSGSPVGTFGHLDERTRARVCDCQTTKRSRPTTFCCYIKKNNQPWIFHPALQNECFTCFCIEILLCRWKFALGFPRGRFSFTSSHQTNAEFWRGLMV